MSDINWNPQKPPLRRMGKWFYNASSASGQDPTLSATDSAYYSDARSFRSSRYGSKADLAESGSPRHDKEGWYNKTKKRMGSILPFASKRDHSFISEDDLQDGYDSRSDGYRSDSSYSPYSSAPGEEIAMNLEENDGSLPPSPIVPHIPHELHNIAEDADGEQREESSFHSSTRTMDLSLHHPTPIRPQIFPDHVEDAWDEKHAEYGHIDNSQSQAGGHVSSSRPDHDGEVHQDVEREVTREGSVDCRSIPHSSRRSLGTTSATSSRQKIRYLFTNPASTVRSLVATAKGKLFRARANKSPYLMRKQGTRDLSDIYIRSSTGLATDMDEAPEVHPLRSCPIQEERRGLDVMSHWESVGADLDYQAVVRSEGGLHDRAANHHGSQSQALSDLEIGVARSVGRRLDEDSVTDSNAAPLDVFSSDGTPASSDTSLQDSRDDLSISSNHGDLRERRRDGVVFLDRSTMPSTLNDVLSGYPWSTSFSYSTDHSPISLHKISQKDKRLSSVSHISKMRDNTPRLEVDYGPSWLMPDDSGRTVHEVLLEEQAKRDARLEDVREKFEEQSKYLRDLMSDEGQIDVGDASYLSQHLL
ncbi:hypothetical protein L198_00404 [Cryptococcus wingfieldii CBS 7118]|uniref:Uncharacterized protein n=1 Tax=Cryptococcus wingfieldii CBS 7118 TaxID=1295528 RepID=A0A1E3K8V3_9TREE|nr:hypothetical protein L198_00404 [Cryptococcus wingfieldii CBS 7118]ODO08672.1 hypothetical protein L198_00404 [Cryptococcus wingfieldii CBS 7118]